MRLIESLELPVLMGDAFLRAEVFDPAVLWCLAELLNYRGYSVSSADLFHVLYF